MRFKNMTPAIAVAFLVTALNVQAENSKSPIAKADLVFNEVDGILAFEAEHFYKQTLVDTRAWHITSLKAAPEIKPDADPSHVAGASSGAYIEILPDSRATHSHKMIHEENFTEKPGSLAIAHYKVNIQNPGRYYVWLRTFSTGSEDNGVHIGINGQWPESGQRWQTTQKNAWTWDCKQRTEKVHNGVPMQLYLDIENPGEHELTFSLREDGFEMDKIVIASSKDFTPEGMGPAVNVKSGTPPAIFPQVTQPITQKKSTATTATVIPLVLPRKADGKGTVEISGDLMEWHKVTLTLDGPYAHEQDNAPNPFTDHNLTVTFTHESGSPSYKIPGYFTADGSSGESSAESGTKWCAHLSPDKEGVWNYTISFTTGHHAALDGGGSKLKPFDGISGSFKIAKTDKIGRDFRAKGRLQYVGKHHLQFAGSKDYFLKYGPDSPENFLGSTDFDGTTSTKKGRKLKTWESHINDWRQGDPTWKSSKGKGVIGALNYLASKGCNVFSFLTYNAGGDGDDVWPFIQRNDKLHYDCSKLDQWTIVLDHATQNGIYCHFKLQETENDDQRAGDKKQNADIPTALDGGKLGPERKLYLREMVARFGHLLALNWNFGEENTQTTEEQRAMIDTLAKLDAYQHLRVLHTYPGQQSKVYTPLLGKQSALTGASIQIGHNDSHDTTLAWIQKSAKSGKPWVVAHDEQGGADTGVPPDLGYQGYNGKKNNGGKVQTTDDIRKFTLWGNLMAGGAGVEYYFGYQLPQTDLNCEDYRSRDKSWDYARTAVNFFHENKIPFWEMKNANELIGNHTDSNSKYCLAKKGEIYLIYLPNGGETEIDLSNAPGEFTLSWFNPRQGGELEQSKASEKGGTKVQLKAKDQQDWLGILKKQ